MRVHVKTRRDGATRAVDDSNASVAMAWWSYEIQDALFDCTSALHLALDQMRARPEHDPESLDMLMDAVDRMESAIAASEPLDFESAMLLLQFLRFNCKPTIQRMLVAARIDMAYRQTLNHIAAA